VRVPGGSVLLHVRNVVGSSELALEEVRGRIERELEAERIEEAIARRVADRMPPPDALVLAPEQLAEVLDGGDPEAAVLELDDDRLTAAQLRQRAGLGPSQRVADLDDEARERLARAYRREEEQRLLALELLESADPELRQDAEAPLRQAGVARLVDERIRDEMGRLVDADEDKLRRFWEDNRHHYQSPLRFKLKLWNLPFDADPPRQLQRMEALREKLAAGTLQLGQAAAELGGEIEDLGWRDLDSLADEIPSKAQTYLMQVGASGYSVPYQQEQALHLLWLEERQEPRPLDYPEAREQVREGYLMRFQQDLHRRALEARLAAAGFHFDESAVRSWLVPPSELEAGRVTPPLQEAADAS
jgi:hypothetical protein